MPAQISALPSATAGAVRMLRCAAARPEDSSPCEGGHAVVRVVDQYGREATGCVPHAAALYASLIRPRVYPTPGHDADATAVYYRAQALKPTPRQTAA